MKRQAEQKELPRSKRAKTSETGEETKGGQILMPGESRIVGLSTISNEDGVYKCTCKEFEKKKACKHIKEFRGEEPSRRSGRIAKQGDVDYTLCEEEKDEPGRFNGVMLASKYDGKADIKGWIMSEKLDGVRCVWTGKAMYTRNGNAFYPPDFFTEGLPKNTVLDGELFLGRGKFPETMSIVRKQTAHDGWKEIKYLIFDGPELSGGFKTRLKKLKDILEPCQNPYV
jgi:DNA ligase-1